MPSAMQTLGIDRMSRNERIELVHDIWNSIAAEPGPSFLSDAKREELKRRIAEDDADPDGGIPWEVVERETRQHLSSRRVER